MLDYVNPEIARHLRGVFVCIMLLATMCLSCGGSGEDGEAVEAGGKGAPVEVMAVQPGREVLYVKSVGVAEALYDADVSAETSGRVVRIVHDIGERVKEGETVIELEDRVYELRFQSARARMEVAESANDKAQRDLVRMEDLFASHDISVSELEQARLTSKSAGGEYELAVAELGLAEEALDDTRIAAPFDGEITRVHVKIGEIAQVGQMAFTLVQSDTIEVEVALSTEDLQGVEVGQTVEFSSLSLPNFQKSGRVYSISGKASDLTRRYSVEIRAANPEHFVKPGMQLDARIVTGVIENAIVIPLDAVLIRQQTQVVFIQDGPVARQREITVAFQRGDKAVISEGINAGDRLITVGQHNLRDGQKIIVTE
jgi:RND family efflux transporter MFP subunit